MRKLMRICFAVALLTFGVASAQDTGNHNNMMKAEDSENEVQITGTISDTARRLSARATIRTGPSPTLRQ